jgi:hypothetical protein
MVVYDVLDPPLGLNACLIFAIEVSVSSQEIERTCIFVLRRSSLVRLDIGTDLAVRYSVFPFHPTRSFFPTIYFGVMDDSI